MMKRKATVSSLAMLLYMYVHVCVNRPDIGAGFLKVLEALLKHL